MMMRSKTYLVLTFGMMMAGVWGGCHSNSSQAQLKKASDTGQLERADAVAMLTPTTDNKAQGTVHFISEIAGTRVVATISGLTPGVHGFHIHEKGDCSAPDASSAGGHFNPEGVPHGGADDEVHHVGDLGNIRADENGVARLDHVFDFLKLEGPHSIIGKAVIVHQGKDDLSSQPSGDAGARVACGVIHSG